MLEGTKNFRATLTGALCAAAVLLIADVADARSFRRAEIPHGNTVDCQGCHNGRGGSRNDFGLDMFPDFLTSPNSSGSVIWNIELAELDSDGDGYTNGEELGDPLGTWSSGDADPDMTPSNPGSADETPCGNGTLEGPESCDGDNFGGLTCGDFGFDEGELGCDENCQIDDFGCFSVVCGDGEAVDFEECDTEDLRGETCESLGYDGGELGCDDTCLYDESGCFSSICGNDFIEGPEACDGADLGGEDCVSLGFDSGELSCSTECTLDTSACVGEPVAVCGNGVIEEGEECDGEALDGATCQTFEFDDGVIGCAPDCTFNTDFCRNFECGDGVIEGDEECDGDAFGDATCESLGFDGGDLGCDDACAITTDTCDEAGEDTGTPDAGTDAGSPDAGTPDAGTDAGEPDTSTPDAGTPEPDADESDAGAEEDASTSPDGGTDDGGEGGSGGGCAAAGSAPGAGLWLLALVALARRRR